ASVPAPPHLAVIVEAPPGSALVPYTTLFRSAGGRRRAGRGPAGAGGGRSAGSGRGQGAARQGRGAGRRAVRHRRDRAARHAAQRSEEHTSELQSRENLVCRLLLEKKKHRRSP